MNSLVLSFLASICTAFSSLCFRKNIDNAPANDNASGYLTLFYLVSFLLSFFHSDLLHAEVNWIILSIGACVGFLSSTLMFLTSRALQRGPAGLTFAFQNASAIFPGLLLFLFLGSDFGYSCSYFQLGGMLLVLLGLFSGAKKEASNQPKASSKWLKYALACFIVQILALTFIQARCLLFDPQLTEGSWLLSDFTVSEADDVWFMPGQFGASFAMQGFIFLREHKKFQIREVMFGSLAGIGNFASTCLLLLATKHALPFEQGILFPCFAVASMVLCNAWANRLYKEQFNLKTNLLCSVGIFLAVSA